MIPESGDIIYYSSSNGKRWYTIHILAHRIENGRHHYKYKVLGSHDHSEEESGPGNWQYIDWDDYRKIGFKETGSTLAFL